MGDIQLRAAIYCRVSTLDQARDGMSLDTQEEYCRKYADLHDLCVQGVFRDEGVSAKDLNRLMWRQLVIDLSSFDAVIVQRLDRLTRSVGDFASTIYPLFMERGVALHAVSDHLDSSSASGRLQTNMLLSVAQWQRESTVERVVENMRRGRASGFCMGRAPFGWVLVKQDGPGSLLQPDVLEQLVIEKARELRGDGFSFRDAGRVLAGLFGKPQWAFPATVKRICESPIVAELVDSGSDGVFRLPSIG